MDKIKNLDITKIFHDYSHDLQKEISSNMSNTAFEMIIKYSNRKLPINITTQKKMIFAQNALSESSMFLVNTAVFFIF